MRDALRAEILKARSGFWMLLVLAYALLLPFIVWQFAAVSDDSVLACVAACPIAATFLGCYLVTRDYYYKSIERTVLVNRRTHVYAAKIVAGGLGGMVVGLVGAGGWTAVTWLSQGHRLDTGANTWQMLGGCVAACVLAGVFGVAIGWILPNYYLATVVSLLLPFAVEVPLATSLPEIARFLPNSALAGLVQAPVPGLFAAWLSALVALLWISAAVVTGWRLFERREVL